MGWLEMRLVLRMVILLRDTRLRIMIRVVVGESDLLARSILSHLDLRDWLAILKDLALLKRVGMRRLRSLCVSLRIPLGSHRSVFSHHRSWLRWPHRLSRLLIHFQRAATLWLIGLPIGLLIILHSSDCWYFCLSREWPLDRPCGIGPLLPRSVRGLVKSAVWHSSKVGHATDLWYGSASTQLATISLPILR
jgi:hypothetical protein